MMDWDFVLRWLPWLYLAMAVAGASLTLNALAPVRRNRVLLLPSFLAGTVAVELAAYLLVAHCLAAVSFVAAGALTGPVGWSAVIVSGVSAVGLSVLFVQGVGAAAAVRRALLPVLGRPARPVPGLWRLLVPFPLRGATDRVTRNVTFAKVAGQRLRLDVYHPKRSVPGKRWPAVIHVHGGGWTVGDKREQGVPLMAVVADRGFVGFNINYRLSPGATWPDHLVDVKRAIAWVRAHADEYDVDPSCIAIAGGSAGGHLASMAALTADDPSLQPGFEDADVSVAAVAAFYAIYDLTDEKGRHVPGFIETLLQPIVLKAFYDQVPERFAEASPIHRLHRRAPPFFVIHGDRDTLAPLADARDFVQALRATSGQPVAFAELRGAQHSFDFFISPRSLPVLEGVAEFFEHVAHDASARSDRLDAQPDAGGPEHDVDALEAHRA
ncbi:MAG: alpha/beta hydrolase [Myxococcota bacterium]